MPDVSYINKWGFKMSNDKSRNTSITINNVKWVELSAVITDKTEYRNVRRAVRANVYGDDVQTFFGRLCVKSTVTRQTLLSRVPAPKRSPIAPRTDGRSRYIVHANETEIANVRKCVPGDCIIDTRERGKQRRAAKRAAKTAANGATE
jgi:hypothetical protein